MGVNELNDIFQKLTQVRTNIIKLSHERRKTPQLQTKLDNAKTIYSGLNSEIANFNQKIKNFEVEESEILLVKDLIEKIRTLYKEICDFGKKKESSGTEMASFDLKVAVSLLPNMDGTEDTTNKLIDAIELYDAMLNDDGKPLLIKFVLKTRISNSAKLRLKANYATVNELLTDIRTHLLTRKSDTAIQVKLLRTRQGDKSVEDFGKELEELFVNLTIAQANGNHATYDILRPINEKTAIKRFADGLRNQKLSTIIASQKFEYLKDAIRAAQDEEIIAPNNSSHVMTFSKRDRGHFHRNSSRGFYNNTNFNRGNNNYSNRNFNNSVTNNNNPRVNNNNNNQRAQHFQRNFRGRSFNRSHSNRRGSPRYNMHFADRDNNPGQEHVVDSSETFFRP